MSITAEKLKALVIETTISGWAMDFLSEAQWSIIADKLNAMIAEQTPSQPTSGGVPEHCVSLAELRRLNKEYQDIRERFAPTDAAGHLMELLGIPRENVQVRIGGSNAPIFKKAADEIERLQSESIRLRTCETCDLIGGEKCSGLRCDECYSILEHRCEQQTAEIAGCRESLT